MTTAFADLVVAPVRQHLRRPVRLPTVAGTWHLEHDRGTPVLGLDLDAAELGHNLQTDRPAAPFFLLAFAYWFGHLNDVEPRLRLRVQGPPPEARAARLHHRRAWIALEALQAALGERLDVQGAPERRWPEHPFLNAPRIERVTTAEAHTGAEHQVEVQLTREAEHAEAFASSIAPLTAFRRQLPLGLFDREVAHATRWTPGNGAQADLWSVSPDGRTFHLFELKVGANATVGVVPELLTYLWILHRVRTGGPDGQRIEGGGPGADAARAADRLHGWIVAPRLHPLLRAHGLTPLQWLAEGLPETLNLGLAPFDDGGSKTGFVGWRTGEVWPGRRG